MNNHVPKLETCKKLKELGYPQDNREYDWDFNDKWLVWSTSSEYKPCSDERVAAPLATELLEWLPNELTFTNNNPQSMYRGIQYGFERLYIEKTKLYTVTYCNYTCTEGELDKEEYHPTVANTLPEALAQMLIYLVENKIVNFTKEG